MFVDYNKLALFSVIYELRGLCLSMPFSQIRTGFAKNAGICVDALFPKEFLILLHAYVAGLPDISVIHGGKIN